jgi:hypothetical protein
MGIPYRARVDERAFLNLPGFHGGAYVRPPPSALPEGWGVLGDALLRARDRVVVTPDRECGKRLMTVARGRGRLDGIPCAVAGQ